MLPRFEVVGRRRPIALVAATATLVDAREPEASYATPHPAPYAGVTAVPGPEAERVELELASGEVRLVGWYDAASGRLGLEVTTSGRTTKHASRRHGRAATKLQQLGLTLTGTHLTVLGREAGRWVARGRVDLAGRFDPRNEAWLAGLHSSHRGDVSRFSAGGFGQLGLRDIRWVTRADGTPYRDGAALLLTATSAGPGFFDTGHTSVWALDPASLTLEHRADLFFRRPDRPGVFGDHATHLVREGEEWLVATSTWGDFDGRRKDASVAVTVARSSADLLAGRHVLDTVHLDLPTTGLTSVGVWDPHLVRTPEGWLVAYVSAQRFFQFHPVLAEGPSLDRLTLRGAAPDRLATEGTTLLRLDEGWRLLASDGPDGRSGQRRRYPIFDLHLTEIGELDAPYPTNIPWPSLARQGDDWLMATFDGTAYGGDVVGYGSHGDVVLMRGVSP
ncbi:hypothetical protein [Nocardioides sp.]|uniref:hypothetical protein n=1 Tax=Nocardioides sp. TaxID=35761 RepID=UPI0031FF374C|nr:hypothetical protein [Nocardioides sp.]